MMYRYCIASRGVVGPYFFVEKINTANEKEIDRNGTSDLIASLLGGGGSRATLRRI